MKNVNFLLVSAPGKCADVDVDADADTDSGDQAGGSCLFQPTRAEEANPLELAKRINLLRRTFPPGSGPSCGSSEPAPEASPLGIISRRQWPRNPLAVGGLRARELLENSFRALNKEPDRKP